MNDGGHRRDGSGHVILPWCFATVWESSHDCLPRLWWPIPQFVHQQELAVAVIVRRRELNCAAMISKRKQKLMKFIFFVAISACVASNMILYTHDRQLALRRMQRRRQFAVPRPLRAGVTFSSITCVYNESMFRRAFRMDQRMFEVLVDIVRDDITKDEEMGKRSGRTTLPPDIKVAVFLRMMAGGSYLDMPTSYRIGTSSAHAIFNSVLEAVNRRIQLPGLPKSRAALKIMSDEFKTSRVPHSPLSGCVGALDGIAIKIKKPADTLRPKEYFCRKHFFALPVQALVNAKYQFIDYSARTVGSTHDSLSHAVSGLGRYLERGELLVEFWLVGDDAYVCTEFLITPVPAAEADEHEDAFNFFHSSMRMHVEQAFGMLVARWRILKTGMNFSVGKASRVVLAAMKLHNFCLEYSTNRQDFLSGLSRVDAEEAVKDAEDWYEEAKDLMEDWNRCRGQERRARRVVACHKRKALVAIIREKNLLRPAVPLPL